MLAPSSSGRGDLNPDGRRVHGIHHVLFDGVVRRELRGSRRPVDLVGPGRVGGGLGRERDGRLVRGRGQGSAGMSGEGSLGRVGRSGVPGAVGGSRGSGVGRVMGPAFAVDGCSARAYRSTATGCIRDRLVGETIARGCRVHSPRGGDAPRSHRRVPHRRCAARTGSPGSGRAGGDDLRRVHRRHQYHRRPCPAPGRGRGGAGGILFHRGLDVRRGARRSGPRGRAGRARRPAVPRQRVRHRRRRVRAFLRVQARSSPRQASRSAPCACSTTRSAI